jgi:hypothetical protein
MKNALARWSLGALLPTVLIACSSAPPAPSQEATGEASEASTTVYGTARCTPTTQCTIPGSSPCTGNVPQVTWNPGSWGGWTLAHPSIFLVHWGAYWATTAGAAQAAADTAAWKAIGQDPRFWSPLAEYSFPGKAPMTPATDAQGHILFGSVVDVNAASSVLSSQVPGSTLSIPTNVFQAALKNELTTGILPDPSTQPDTIWVVILPPGVSGDGTVDAHHSDININTKNYPYAVIPGSGAIVGHLYEEEPNPSFPSAQIRGQDIAISHEVYEAVSDPAGLMGWLDFNQCAGKEIADMCEGLVSDPIDGYTLSTFWSNVNNGCIGPASLNTSTPVVPYGSCGCATNADTLQTVCAPQSATCCAKNGGNWVLGRCIYKLPTPPVIYPTPRPSTTLM